MNVLTLNAGSSSIKFCLYDMTQELRLAFGIIENIGDKNSHCLFQTRTDDGMQQHRQDCKIPDHAVGLQYIFNFLDSHDPLTSMQSLHAIGHRVVHGGEKFNAPVIIDADVIATIRTVTPLAPLHNPANLVGIETATRLYPQLPQVAVFDTGFFQTLPARAYRYALPDKLFQDLHVRRYGFHGISHQYVAGKAAEYLQHPLGDLKLITLHLGNGASAAAIRDGVCIDTSMGMTPLEGLVMGSRCGDIDPSIPSYLARTLNLNPDEVDTLLNHDSGMKGLCDASDMREIRRLANTGNEQAQLAIDIYCYRIVKYIGAYYTALGGLDALVFTAGIGEHDPVIRQMVCDRLSVLDIGIDDSLNRTTSDSCQDISVPDSKCKVLVIPTDEELAIARQTVSLTDG